MTPEGRPVIRAISDLIRSRSAGLCSARSSSRRNSATYARSTPVSCFTTSGGRLTGMSAALLSASALVSSCCWVGRAGTAGFRLFVTAGRAIGPERRPDVLLVTLVPQLWP